MALKQTATDVVTDPRGYLTGIHGPAAVGKTSFCQQIPGHYFLYTPNGGIEGLAVFGEPILNWADFISRATELLAAKKANFKDQREVKVIVLDIFTDLFEYAGIEVCKTQNFMEKGVAKKYDKIDDVPWGKGFKATVQLLLRNIGVLMLNGFGVVFTSHTKERVVKWAGNDCTHFGLNLPPSACLAITAACGAIAHFTVEETIQRNEQGDIIKAETGRFMHWQPNFLRLAKHRLEGFPACLPLPINEGWQIYCDAFAKTVEEVKTNAAQIQRILAAANAERNSREA